MYMAGGEYPDGSASKAVWRYDPTLDVWQEVESMQKPRSELGEFINIRFQIEYENIIYFFVESSQPNHALILQAWHYWMALFMRLVDGKVLQG